MRRAAGGRRRGALLLLLLALAAFLWVLRAQGDRPLEIVFLDVGQGDATLVRTPDGRTVLVDGGKSWRRLEPQLDALRVERLDLLVATHADFDHIGALPGAVERYQPAAFVDNGVPHPTRAYDRLLEAVEAAGSRYLEGSARTLTLGELVLELLPPLRFDPEARGADEQNENSVGVLLRWGDVAVLLPGDATAAEQAWWSRCCLAGLDDVEVYRAAHHGSRTGDREAFVRALAPDWVIVSAGRDNAYGHPHPEALAAYRAAGARVLRTDEVGAVTVTVARGGAVPRVRSGAVAPAGDGVLAALESGLRRLLGELARELGLEPAPAP